MTYVLRPALPSRPRPHRQEDPESARSDDGDGLLVLSNRLPVQRVQQDGVPTWRVSPGGLVSALAPVLRATGGSWVGWPGVVDADVPPFTEGGIANVPVRLDRRDVANYYHGFSNRTLWPLFHDAVRAPVFRASWWGTYEQVNRRFAHEVARRAPRGGRVWVQDYHLMLVPELVRAIRPDLSIGFFLHIPFPPTELFEQLPWAERLLAGLLGADLVGFQTEPSAQRFAETAAALLDVERDGLDVRVRDDDGSERTCTADAFPISIDVGGFERLARDPEVRRSAARIRDRLGPDRKILLGVDRLDYTKGIDQRLRAYKRLLERGDLRVEDCVMVLSTVPSRQSVKEYEEQKRLVQGLVGEINGEFSTLEREAIHYLHKNHDAPRLAALYAAADVALVTPLRDGMNLVCKEYVASRLDDSGVLVLSRFAGAARELTDAVLVNPHDGEGLDRAILEAVRMAPDEARARMSRMRRHVRKHDVHRWAETFLDTLRRCSGERPAARAPRPGGIALAR